MTFDLDTALREADEYEKSREPIDAQVVIGKRVVTVRIPYLPGREFDDATAAHTYPFPYRDVLGCWFNLDAVTQNHPRIVLVNGKGAVVDDLTVVKDDESHYRWPEVYAALSTADKMTLQAVVWGVYIHDPEQRIADAKEAARERV
ncbi:hypothetical protein [Microbacterium sp. EST19A]|uniref:hypothetical protein n=1 Tax=Microbacterium sp. EST19A TaxID=2862681 RepID=UPI001CC0A334|nr:hypothetical protein [Microbacterium sp. EST19A]